MPHARVNAASVGLSHHSRKRSGVTLMELIVALTITGLMAAVGSIAFGTVIDSKRVVKESTSDTERASALRESLRLWLLPATVMIQRGSPPRIGTAATAGRAGAGVNPTATTRTPNGAQAVSAAASTGDEITFTTTAPNPANSPNARMRLFIDGDEATPEHGLTLEYQVSQQTPLQRRQLDSTVTSMKVEYLDQRTNRWFAASDPSATTPKALRLTLLPSEDSPLSPLLQVPLVFMLTGGFGVTVFQNGAR